MPDEPYRFGAEDGPEAFPGVSATLVSGRHLAWYGPSLAEAPALFAAQLAQPVRAAETGRTTPVPRALRACPTRPGPGWTASRGRGVQPWRAID